MFRCEVFGLLKKSLCLVLSLTLVLSSTSSYAQSAFVSTLPEPGAMVGTSEAFTPVLVKGLIVHPDKPLNFDFIVDSGNDSPDQAVVKDQSQRMAKYFLAALTVPEAQLWVNLSPYEQDRVIEDDLGQTVLGRDMLAQDYVLKQLTASMVYPEKGLGKEFWARVYQEAQEKFGTTDIPVDTFNKVWIMPDTAEVFEKGTAVYVTQAKLKVMMDSDYLAQSRHPEAQGAEGSPVQNDNKLNNAGGPSPRPDGRAQDDVSSTSISSTQELSKQILREVVLPAIEKEVNEGRNFATIRQVYHAAILAKWYRELIQNTLLANAYVGTNKVAGVESDEKALKEEIYQRYIAAYKKGVFDYIKEEADSATGETMPRKYFSGGETFDQIKLARTTDPAMAGAPIGKVFKVDLAMSDAQDTVKEAAADPQSLKKTLALVVSEAGRSPGGIYSYPEILLSVVHGIAAGSMVADQLAHLPEGTIAYQENLKDELKEDSKDEFKEISDLTDLKENPSKYALRVDIYTTRSPVIPVVVVVRDAVTVDKEILFRKLHDMLNAIAAQVKKQPSEALGLLARVTEIKSEIEASKKRLKESDLNYLKSTAGELLWQLQKEVGSGANNGRSGLVADKAMNDANVAATEIVPDNEYFAMLKTGKVNINGQEFDAVPVLQALTFLQNNLYFPYVMPDTSRGMLRLSRNVLVYHKPKPLDGLDPEIVNNIAAAFADAFSLELSTGRAPFQKSAWSAVRFKGLFAFNTNRQLNGLSRLLFAWLRAHEQGLMRSKNNVYEMNRDAAMSTALSAGFMDLLQASPQELTVAGLSPDEIQFAQQWQEKKNYDLLSGLPVPSQQSNVIEFLSTWKGFVFIANDNVIVTPSLVIDALRAASTSVQAHLEIINGKVAVLVFDSQSRNIELEQLVREAETAVRNGEPARALQIGRIVFSPPARKRIVRALWAARQLEAAYELADKEDALTISMEIIHNAPHLPLPQERTVGQQGALANSLNTLGIQLAAILDKANTLKQIGDETKPAVAREINTFLADAKEALSNKSLGDVWAVAALRGMLEGLTAENVLNELRREEIDEQIARAKEEVAVLQSRQRIPGDPDAVVLRLYNRMPNANRVGLDKIDEAKVQQIRQQATDAVSKLRMMIDFKGASGRIPSEMEIMGSIVGSSVFHPALFDGDVEQKFGIKTVPPMFIFDGRLFTTNREETLPYRIAVMEGRGIFDVTATYSNLTPDDDLAAWKDRGVLSPDFDPTGASVAKGGYRMLSEGVDFPTMLKKLQGDGITPVLGNAVGLGSGMDEKAPPAKVYTAGAKTVSLLGKDGFFEEEFPASVPPNSLLEAIRQSGIKLSEGSTGLDGLNILLEDKELLTNLRDNPLFKKVKWLKEVSDQFGKQAGLSVDRLRRVNRLALEAAYPECPKRAEWSVRSWVTSAILSGLLGPLYIAGPDMNSAGLMGVLQTQADQVHGVLGLPKIPVTTSIAGAQFSFNHFNWTVTSGSAVEALLRAFFDEWVKDRYDVKNKADLMIMGFGDVGSGNPAYLQQMFKELLEDGTIHIAAVADINGGVYAPKGLNIAELLRLRKEGSLSVTRDYRAAPGEEVYRFERGVVTREVFEHEFSGGDFDWLMANGFFTESSGVSGHLKNINISELGLSEKLRNQYADDKPKLNRILAVLQQALNGSAVFYVRANFPNASHDPERSVIAVPAAGPGIIGNKFDVDRLVSAGVVVIDSPGNIPLIPGLDLEQALEEAKILFMGPGVVSHGGIFTSSMELVCRAIYGNKRLAEMVKADEEGWKAFIQGGIANVTRSNIRWELARFSQAIKPEKFVTLDSIHSAFAADIRRQKKVLLSGQDEKLLERTAREIEAIFADYDKRGEALAPKERDAIALVIILARVMEEARVRVMFGIGVEREDRINERMEILDAMVKNPSSDEMNQSLAIYELGNMGAERAREGLLQVVQDDHFSIFMRSTAAEALVKMGKKSDVSVLRNVAVAAGANNPGLRFWANWAADRIEKVADAAMGVSELWGALVSEADSYLRAMSSTSLEDWNKTLSAKREKVDALKQQLVEHLTGIGSDPSLKLVDLLTHVGPQDSLSTVLHSEEAQAFMNEIKDAAMGFKVGGVNGTATIRQLTELGGRSIDEIERMARPGVLSEGGFLGVDENFIEVLAQDNDFVLSNGFTHQKLAQALSTVISTGEFGGQRFNVKQIVYREVTVRGSQESLFKDGLSSSVEYTITRESDGRAVKFSGLLVDYISRYGFYEGKGTSYRLDPRDIIKMFYPDKSPKEPTAAVNAVPADLELAPVSPDGQSSGSATLQSRPQGKGIFTDTLKAVFQWLADGGQGEFVLSDRNTLTVEKRSVLRGGNFTDFNGQAQGTMVFSLRNTSGQTTNVNFEELSREIGEEKWSKATVAFFSDAAMNGGIDIKDISVIRKADGQEIKFDERAVREVLQNGFNGFTPVIINITPVASPLLILGVAMPETAPALSSVPAQEISAGRELEPAVI